MKAHRFRAVLGIAALAVLGAVATACWPLGGGNDMITVKARFTDIADMAKGAEVTLGDVSIGKVTTMKVSGTGAGSRALLTMRIEKSARVPAAVEAQVRRTSPLGEKYISLRLPRGMNPNADVPLLHDGDTIRHARVVSDIQDLVAAGTDLFGRISASQLSTILSESAAAFGGRGPELHRLVAQFSDIAKGYASRTGTVAQVVTDLDNLAKDLAPGAPAIQQLLDNLATSTAIVNAESNRTLDLVDSLNGLLSRGNRLLDKHLDQLKFNFQAAADLTKLLADQRVNVGYILQYMPRASRVLQSVDEHDLLYITAHFVGCGMPNGGEGPPGSVGSCYTFKGSG